jgi:hypothetical protein
MDHTLRRRWALRAGRVAIRRTGTQRRQDICIIYLGRVDRDGSNHRMGPKSILKVENQ